uniref:single-pass membrane and coiled-coil domain-containing protein 4 n=1 Tax=Nyctereutes procyonoides TaxID=34880 RepID=UPI0024448EE5|nr:single-pass membrane and coiled-coil domain-containing protein 4 [Nyctereutes procyonoides]
MHVCVFLGVRSHCCLPKLAHLHPQMRQGTTRVTFTGNHFAGSPETAVLEVKRRFGASAGEVWPFLPDPLRRTLLASLRQDAAAQRQAQEGNVQGQEGAEAGHAGGPAADHHGGAAHAGRGRAPDRGVRVRGHAPRHHRMSAGGGLPQQAAEARDGEGKRKMAFVFRDFPNAEL